MRDLPDLLPAAPLAYGGPVAVINPHPFASATLHADVPEGATVEAIVALAGIEPRFHGFVRVWICDTEVPREAWGRVRPIKGAQVYVRVMPQGGGGSDGSRKNGLAMLLMLVVTVGAAFAGPAVAGALGFAAGSPAFLVTSGLVGSAVSMVGSLAIRALIPPPQGDDGIVSQRALLSGVRNQFAPYAFIPRIFGKRRVFPLQAARPYTEAQGKNRYLRVLLCAGWGPLAISDIRIGNTPIAAFSGVNVEVIEGWDTASADFGALPGGKAPEAAPTLFTRSVTEENFVVLLDDAGRDGNGDPILNPGPWQIRTTADNAREAIVDITFPYGLGKNKEETEEVTIDVDVQYRLAGTAGSWLDAVWEGPEQDDGTNAGNGKLRGRDKTRSPTSRGGRFKFPAAGTYDVRLRRNTEVLTGGAKTMQRTDWTSLRTIRYEAPVNLPGLCLIAIRMKATDQLNGLPDTINCVAQSYLPEWDGSAWTYALSRNPAWAFADLIRRRGVQRMIADDRIDLPALSAWSAACLATAPNAAHAYWLFDGIMERGSVFTGLKQIAAHARATFCVRDGLYSVVTDYSQVAPAQHITPRNSWGYSGSKSFTDLPNALKVQFINEAEGYQEDEVIVYADGFTAANADRFESIELPCCTRAEQAWRDGRYHLAVGQLRPEEHHVSMDVENLRCTIGDLVVLAHDVLSIGVGYGRTVERLVSGPNVIGYRLDVEFPMYAGIDYALRMRIATGGTRLFALVPVAADTNTDTIYIAVPEVLATMPNLGVLAIVGEVERETAPMIVKEIRPGPDLSARLTLVDAQAGVWTADSQPIPPFNTFVNNDTPVPMQKPGAPLLTLTSDEGALLLLSDGTLQDRIGVMAVAPSGGVQVSHIEVQARETGAVDWLQIAVFPVAARQVFVSPVRAGSFYDVRARTITETGLCSDWTTETGHEVIGKTTPPADVAGLTATALTDGVQLSWTPNVELDIAGYEVRLGEDWDSAAVVNKLVPGNSLFVGISVVGLQTFLVRAVDVIGLQSQSPAMVSAQTTAPATVEGFFVHAQNDDVRATWTPVPGTGIVYEVREGVSWVNSRRVVRSGSSAAVFKWPTASVKSSTFWIKALSPAGIYSDVATFAVVAQAPTSNKNVLVSVDFSSDTWAGAKVNLATVGSGLGSDVQVSTLSDGLSAARASYTRKVTLAANFTARTWAEIALLCVQDLDIPFNEVQTAWADAAAMTWDGAVVDNSTTEVKPEISLSGEALPATLIDGVRLDGSLPTIRGVSAATTASISYAPCQFSDGLVMGAATTARWAVVVPLVWSMAVDFKMTRAADNYAMMAMGMGVDRQSNANAGSLGSFFVVGLRGNVSGRVQRIIYDATLGAFVFNANTGTDLVLPMAIEQNELVTLAASQNADGSRALHAYSHRTGLFHHVSGANSVPAGNGEWMYVNDWLATYANAPGVLGDFATYTTEMDAAGFIAFVTQRRPLGAYPWQPLIPADYGFQTAFVRLTVDVGDRGQDVFVTDAKLRVDVPDILDSGSVAVSAGGTAVTFARTFNSAPAVSVIQTGGAVTAVPRITAGPTTTGFTVFLYDAANPATAVAGTINFNAKGY